jgi:hypothetical protein
MANIKINRYKNNWEEFVMPFFRNAGVTWLFHILWKYRLNRSRRSEIYALELWWRFHPVIQSGSRDGTVAELISKSIKTGRLVVPLCSCQVWSKSHSCFKCYSEWQTQTLTIQQLSNNGHTNTTFYYQLKSQQRQIRKKCCQDKMYRVKLLDILKSMDSDFELIHYRGRRTTVF